MLHIVLLILKIIGIVLAVLLGVLLLGLCLALFVPLRYQIEAKRTLEEGDPPIEIRARFTWLLHFIHVGIYYPADVYVKVRIFFITVFRFPQKKKQEDHPEKNGRKKQKKSKKQSESVPSENTKSEYAPSKEETKSPSGKEEQAALPAGGEQSAQEDAEEDKIRSRKSVKGFFRFLKKEILKICRFFQNIQYTIKRICDKIKTIWENIDYYFNILKGDAFKNSFALCKGELYSIFSYVKPRRMEADLIVGTGDPASTATILAYYGMLYPVIGDHVAVTPDFDEKRIEGTVFIKGKVMLFPFVKAAIRVYFNKDIRKLLKLFKKEDA